MATLQKCFLDRKRTKCHEGISAIIYYWTLFILFKNWPQFGSMGKKNEGGNNSWKLLAQESPIRSLQRQEYESLFTLGCLDKTNFLCFHSGVFLSELPQGLQPQLSMVCLVGGERGSFPLVCLHSMTYGKGLKFSVSTRKWKLWLTTHKLYTICPIPHNGML